MSVLITGGTGKTGLKLARLLRAASIPVLLASRKGDAPDSFPAVTLNWDDPATFAFPFQKDSSIDKVYIVLPFPDGALGITKPFIDLALEKGVKQFVLLGGSSAERGKDDMGAVYAYLDDKGVDHAMLRPTWFSDNFTSMLVHDINKNNEIVTSAGDGRVPFVASQDIANCAFEIFTSDSKELKNAQPYVLGPELFSYDEVAELLSEITGRKITHRRRHVDETLQLYLSFGIPKSSAEFLANLDLRVQAGSEVKAFNAEGGKEVKYIGKTTLREYLEENKGAFVI